MDPVLRRKLDRITDAMHSEALTDTITYINQVAYLIYLKLLDEEEAQHELLGYRGTGGRTKIFPNQAKRFRWSAWPRKNERELHNFVRNEVFPYMASVVKEYPHVADYFRGAVLEIANPHVLKQVTDELDSIEFSKLEPNVGGDIFEYVLSHLGKPPLSGQFRTPRHIRAFMIRMVDPDLGDTIYDPACGTAGFLIDALDYILARYSEYRQEVPVYGEEWLEKRNQTLKAAREETPNLQTYASGSGDKIPDWDVLERSIHGTDVSRNMIRIATINLALHRVLRAPLRRENALEVMSIRTPDDRDLRYSVILCHPPFGGHVPAKSIHLDLPSKSGKSELLFLSLMMQSLAPGGRCAVVVPESTLFGSTKAHTQLRVKLLRDYEVQAVVSLPPGVFRPYTRIKTSVIVFRRPTNKPESGNSATGRVWFCEIRNDGYDPNRLQGGSRIPTPEKNDIPGLLADWGEYEESGFDKPPGVEFGALFDGGAEELCSWWAGFDAIAEHGYDLTVSRYRPRVAVPVPEEDPAELVRAVLAVEREIVDGLEDLLKIVEEG